MTLSKARLLLATLALSVLAGCAGTRAAYRAADTMDEYAAVIAEHYAALVEEAAQMRENGLDPVWVSRLQIADQKAKPLILALRPLAEAYGEARTAETQAALQAALDKAVMAVHELLNAIRGARGQPYVAVPAVEVLA